MQQRTHIDFETRSLIDLIKVGEHPYARDKSTSPLMLAYGTAPKGVMPDTFDIIDFFKIPGYAERVYPNTKHPDFIVLKPVCPKPIQDALDRGDVFVAHNARFEQAIWYYICHLKWGWGTPAKWSCTAARARYFGIRASLDGAASDLEVIPQKDERGKEFINNFCKPRKYKGRKADGIVQHLWYEPHENPKGWQEGIEYCIHDAKAEAAVDVLLPDLPEFEQKAWEWDYHINTRGVPLNIENVTRAQAFSEFFTAKAVQRFNDLTGVNPTQRDRVLEYLKQREEIDSLGDLRSKTLKRLTRDEFPSDLQDVIQIRLDCSLASIKKLDTMVRCADDDNRVRGIHLYGGAHTMRWSAKRVQTQNMLRGNARVQAQMIAYLSNNKLWNGEYNNAEVYDPNNWLDHAALAFSNPLRALSQSMRGFIEAPEGMQIHAGDFAQIEARVNPWLARATSKLDKFKAKRDLYCEFAAVMYEREYEEYFEYNSDGERSVKKQFKPERQIAKSAELGCGFGLGGPKFQEYCDNSDIIISLEEAKNTVGIWRENNSEIVSFWSRVEEAAVTAVQNPGETVGLKGTDVKFYIWHIDSERYWLVCQLPSGRGLFYYRPKVDVVQRWGRAVYELTFRKEWNGKSYRESTYGGKLVENIVQAIARDMLVVGGLKAEAAGYKSIMLVHDENVTLVPLGFGSAAELCTLLCEQEEWVTDCPIEAEGSTMLNYGK